MPDLLLELFSEEIPARMQGRAAADLKKLVTDGLVAEGLTYAHAEAFATPRRLALAISGLLKETPARREERKGPRVDAPEKALEGFLRSTGLTKEQLEVRADKKGETYFAVIERPGRPASEVIAEVVQGVIANFPWPRSMRWGAGNLRWVRPLHSILCILSEEGQEPEVVTFDVTGIVSGATTQGHRFMSPGTITVRDHDDYVDKLEAAHVILDPAARADRIVHDAEQIAFARGLELVEDKGLLAEVAGLVEWPVVLAGKIEDRFLGLPPEVLQTSMKEHQKFFSLRNPASERIEGFVTVANIVAPDGGETILAGNQRVLAARLSDAAFFWENDRRKSLEEMAAPLAEVTFHNKLGTQGERIARIAALAREIAPMVGADPDMAEQAAKVAKADLASEMVYEFPELQGVMGRYYAMEAGLPQPVADACRDHYAPLGPSDDVPTEPVSVAVSLADKIDMLTGFWAIDEKPTGSKDPFALRRAALGIVRLILENSIRCDLNSLFQLSFVHRLEQFPEVFNVFVYDGDEPSDQLVLTAFGEHSPVDPGKDYFLLFESPRNLYLGDDEMAFLNGEPKPFKLPKPADLAYDLMTFINDRIRVHLRDRGFGFDIINAVTYLGGQDDLALRTQRVEALQKFIDSEDGANLLTAYKRAANILTAEEKKDGVEYSYPPDAKFAREDAEKALFAALDAAEPEIDRALGAEDFGAAMTAMAGLRGPVDKFFDDVTVNDENAIVRRNRLCLLNRIREAMHKVAIFSAVEGG